MKIINIKLHLLRHRTQYVYILMIKDLELYQNIIRICDENHTEHVNMMCKQNIVLLFRYEVNNKFVKVAV
jgi:hypothetical protein